MRLTFDGNKFICIVAFKDRHKVKRAGFVWDPLSKSYITRNPQIAAHLRPYADEDAERKLKHSFITVKPWVGGIPHPRELKPRPYQTLAAKFALTRNRSYIAADPGLGKTIMAALIINAAKTTQHAVYICPPGLCENVSREMDKWLVGCRPIQVWPTIRKVPPEVLIVPDTLLSDPVGDNAGLRELIRHMQRKRATCFVDEAQRYGNAQAQRTDAMIDVVRDFDRIVFMSGTPLRNRPIEAFPILSEFAGECIDFMNRDRYGMKYCGGFWDGFGYDYKGASRVGELADRVHGTFMLRLRKRDHLKDLPPRTDEIVFMGDTTPNRVTRFERKYLGKYSPEDLMEAKLKKASGGHLSTYRRLIGIESIKPAAAIIRETLDWGDEHVIAFCEHLAVSEGLAQRLKEFSPLVVTGETSKKAKQKAIDSFQAGDTRLLIGNTKACGIGHNLTKASRVFHVEPAWVPGDTDQASDRIHRIGQVNPIFIQHLCFKNSIARRVMEASLRKRETIDQL